MSKPTAGRPYKKDITYTDPQKNVKDLGIPKKHFKKATPGMEHVAATKAPVRKYSCG